MTLIVLNSCDKRTLKVMKTVLFACRYVKRKNLTICMYVCYMLFNKYSNKMFIFGCKRRAGCARCFCSKYFEQKHSEVIITRDKTISGISTLYIEVSLFVGKFDSPSYEKQLSFVVNHATKSLLDPFRRFTAIHERQRQTDRQTQT